VRRLQSGGQSFYKQFRALAEAGRTDALRCSKQAL
jgi:hypothetical protein